MGFDMIVILGLAMLLFGPKKLPEISRTIAKFMAEFRKAGYEFKAQIEDEVRKLELQADAERRTKVESGTIPADRPRQIMPPSVGETVGMRRPNEVRDESFDSIAPVAAEEAKVQEVVSPKEPENAEAMKGPNV